MFTIYPAIDLRNGSVVRLKQGDPSQQTIYSDDPVAMTKRWTGDGASWIHVVNLDGAFGDAQAARANRKALAAIAAATQAKIQFGGGVRSLTDVKAAFDAGANRVVIGTAAAENPELIAQVVAQYGAERLVVGLDSRNGMIVTHGWQSEMEITAVELGNRMREMGVIHALYTEVARDGMLTGTAAEMTAALAQMTDLQVIASGGVRNLDDVKELLLYAARGIKGVVIGRALYESKLSLKDAIQVSQQFED